MPTTAQISLARTLLTKTGNSKQKEDIVEGFTNGRTKHISEMYPAEFSALVLHLQALAPKTKKDISAEKMRRRIISMAHEMGWHAVKDGRYILNADGKPKADMKRIDAWCVKYGHGAKKLNKYTYDELPTLVTQFEKAHSSYLKSR